MRQTITPCLIQKKSDFFSVKFTEYPDCELKCSNLEDCLDVAPVFLASYLLSIDEEFKPHTKPLTPKTDNKDQIFTLIKCDMDEMENILIDFKVSAQEFVNWLNGRTDETELPAPAEPEKNADKEETEVSEPVQKEEPSVSEKVINKEEPSASDAADEFDILFNSSPDTIPKGKAPAADVVSEEPSDESSENKDEAVAVTQPDTHGRNDIRQHRNNRNRPEHKPAAPVKDKEADKLSLTLEPIPEQNVVEEPVKEEKPEDEKPAKEPEGLKGKVKDMNYEKHNNAGVFGVIEEEELEFVSKPNNKPKEKTPASTPNRHQQNFNKKNNKHYPKKKKGNNNPNNNNNSQPS